MTTLPTPSNSSTPPTLPIPPDIEQNTGITVYATTTPGTGGTIRQVPEDFIVEELTNREEQDLGKYLICTLTKKNWDTHHLVRDISRILHISQQRIGWAGTKDKQALTTQKISIYNMDPPELERIRLRDVTLTAVGRSNKKVSLGDLWGNGFRIIVRQIAQPVDEVDAMMGLTTSQIKAMGGVPNFFGIQRFGIQRSITHIVGRKLVEGDIEGAALEYIARPYPRESEEARQARQYVLDTLDFKGGLGKFPLHLRYERAMMSHLVEKPGDYAGAFNALSPNLRKMFVHAYQSYLFNLILSRRLESGLPINEALPGDIVCFKNAAHLPDPTRMQNVDEDTLDGINNLLQRGRAFVTGPIIGYETPMSGGLPGEIEQAVIEEEQVDIEGFRIPVVPGLASKGLRREIIIPVNPTCKVTEDKLNPGFAAVELEFDLQRGAYATTVLREYMKSDPAADLILKGK
ncbi:MAG: tRNA pseudouridine(13) synthase TruD [Methanosarcinales archaeon]|nr:tRNA pseudouridine(13) synthase TruD [Methanosarcinales archaeon]